MDSSYKMVMISGLLAVGLLAAMAAKETPQGPLLQRATDESHSHSGGSGHELLADGTQAPDFRLKYIDGVGNIGLDDLGGSFSVLVFVTPTCPYCGEFKTKLLDRDLPDLRGRLVFITPPASAEVILTEEQLELERYVSSTFPVLSDSAQSTAAAYNANSVPTTYLIDDGVIVRSAVGAVEGMKLVEQLVEDNT